MLEQAAKKAGVNPDALRQAVNSGDIDSFARQNLDPKTAENLQKVLSDKSAAEKILNTPTAKEILKKILEEN